MKVLYILFLSYQVLGFQSVSVPKLNGVCYEKPGDLNTGLLVSVSGRGKDEYCDKGLGSQWRPQYVEAFKYAIEQLNNRDDILENITLGYVIMDTCGTDLAALARSLYFIPDGIPPQNQ